MSVLLMAVFQQLHSTLLTLFSSIFQLAALLWYLVSYFPMGSTGLQFMGRIGAQRVTAWKFYVYTSYDLLRDMLLASWIYP
ncbi:hypothetical protein Egran_06879 [Elaphomyces granulatus]|uniref:Protein transport protein SFT2 n=1 Tax=Elaphomyces granulatus TaxID=519963 RepID=A0A232LMH1_9EURO|nr:hypothetical protein Egran_06879 [Elaphomyces granulatus]